MRQHPHLVHPRQQQHYVSQQQQIQQQQPQQQPQQQQQQPQQPQQPHHHPTVIIAQETAPTIKKHNKRSLSGGPYLTHERSFSSSEEDLRSTPEFEGKIYSFFFFKENYLKLRKNI